MTTSPDETRSKLVLGTFFNPPVRGDGTLVYGFDVAVSGVLRALRRHGSLARLNVFAPPHLADAVETAFARDPAPGGPPLRVQGEQALFDGVDGFGIDVWHQTDTAFRAPVHLRKTCATRAYPVTFTVHCQSPQPFLHEYYLPLLIDDLQPYDSFICTSRAAKAACERLLAHVKEDFDRAHGTRLAYPGRVDVIPLGVDTERYAPGDKAALRAALGIAADEIVVLWHGRLSAADKADLLPLLRVFQRLVRKNAGLPLRLFIAGCELASFPFSPAIERAIAELGVADRVTVRVGFPSAQSPSLYAAADVFVSPIDNAQETFGLTPIEAMAAGVPQVVSDWDGYRDTVAHGETGFLVPTSWIPCDEDLTRIAMVPTTPPIDVGYPSFVLGQSVVVDLDAYESHLQALVQNADLRGRMSEASRRRAVEVFGWPSVIRRFEALWGELAAVARRTPLAPLAARNRSYLEPRYTQAFAPYATRMLTGGAVVRLAEAGEDVLADRGSMPVDYGELDLLAFDPFTMRQALRSLARAGAAGLTLDRLVEELAEGATGQTSRLRRHVMRLVKHGLASIAADAANEGAEPGRP
jgi:D-inositol-3-phosphate glycosyltransferase